MTNNLPITQRQGERLTSRKRESTGLASDFKPQILHLLGLLLLLHQPQSVCVGGGSAGFPPQSQQQSSAEGGAGSDAESGDEGEMTCVQNRRRGKEGEEEDIVKSERGMDERQRKEQR